MVDLKYYQQKIEDYANRIIQTQRDPYWSLLVFGEKELSEKMLDPLLEPSRVLLSRGGKRWRPLVTVLSSLALGGDDTAEIYQLSMLSEIPHTGSLIIDDIEDQSPLRRGEKTIHLLFGQDCALNSGNFLYFLPTVFIESMSFSLDIKYTILTHYLATMRKLHLGQGLDIAWHNDPYALPSYTDYLLMCRSKTGALSDLAAYLGTRPWRDNLEAGKMGRIWQDIGACFQMIDDVNNLKTGNPGKKQGDDLLEGKKSLPILEYIALTQKKDSILEDLAKVRQSPADKQDLLITQFISQIKESGALERAMHKAQNLLEEALEKLNSVLPPSAYRQALVELVLNFFVQNDEVPHEPQTPQ